MSVDDDDLPALPEPANVSLRSDDCPQPEDLIDNDRNRRLVSSKMHQDGDMYRVFRLRGGSLSLDDSATYLASTKWVKDVEEWA